MSCVNLQFGTESFAPRTNLMLIPTNLKENFKKAFKKFEHCIDKIRLPKLNKFSN